MLTAAVVGCGRMGAGATSRLGGSLPPGWAPLSHAESVRAVEGIRLVALCDDHEARLKEAGARYGVEALFTDYRELFNAIRPDVVCIATRTTGRADIIAAACTAGVRAIYAEKPLANSIAACRDTLEAISSAGVVLHYGVNRRYHHTYRRARELIVSGVIGDVLDVSVEHGRGLLLWSHPHSVDLMLFLLGSTDIVDIQARLADDTVERSEPRVIDTDPVVEHAVFTFASGARGSITRIGGCNVRVGGSRGTITVRGDGTTLEIDAPTDLQPAYHLARDFAKSMAVEGATVTALRELVASLAGEQPAISRAEVQVGTAMLIGCVWSHLEGGSVVKPADVPADLVVRGRYGTMYA